MASGVAQGEPNTDVVFSNYSPKLRLASYDEQTHTHTFRGAISLTGTLFLVFDMSAPDRANGYINFTKFVPDSAYLSQLPTVIGGFYPGKIKYISLNVPHEQIISLFGGKNKFERISHGREHVVSKPAEVVFKSYSATVECDSRTYFGEAVSVMPPYEHQRTASVEVPSGC